MLEQIRAGLNPDHRYVIFEKASRVNHQSAFAEVLEVLAQLEHGGEDRQLFQDKASGRIYLVVKFGPGRPDNIMQEVLRIGLPDDITCYAYGSHDCS